MVRWLSCNESGVAIGWMYLILCTIPRGGGTKILCGLNLRSLNGGGQGLSVLAYINLSNLIPLTAGLGAQGIPQFYVWKRTA